MGNYSKQTMTEMESKGFEDSENVLGLAKVLTNQLHGLLAQNIKEATDKTEKQKEAIKSIEDEITSLDSLINNLNNRIETAKEEIENSSENQSLIQQKDDEILSTFNNIETKNREIANLIDVVKKLSSCVEEKKLEEQHVDGEEVGTEETNRNSPTNETLKNQPEKSGNFAYRVILISWIMLSGFLFVFYSSTLYSVFLRDTSKEAILSERLEGDNSRLPNPITVGKKFIAIINLDFLNKISEQSIGSDGEYIFSNLITGYLFVFSASGILFSAGLLIFIYRNHKWRYFCYVPIYTLTGAYDVTLAYHIVKNIYEPLHKLSDGREGYEAYINPWSWEMAQKDIIFWIILLSGFAGYIVWGILFTWIASVKDKFEPINNQICLLQVQLEQEQKQKYILENQKQELIKTAQDRLGWLHKEIESNTGKITQSSSKKTELKDKQANIIEKVYVSRGKLEKEVFDYVFGWVKFVSTISESKEKNRLLEDCLETRDLFIGSLQIGGEYIEFATSESERRG
jgi:sulfur transfer protein SufE